MLSLQIEVDLKRIRHDWADVGGYRTPTRMRIILARQTDAVITAQLLQNASQARVRQNSEAIAAGWLLQVLQSFITLVIHHAFISTTQIIIYRFNTLQKSTIIAANLDKNGIGTYYPDSTYRLDDETKGSTRFRIPTALSCSVPSAARTLLRAGGILNRVDPIGRGV